MTLTFTDLFCGAGGSSIGLTEAGLELKLAANHWQRAIDTHIANFADAEHLCADVSNYDLRRLPRTDVLWASPICTELSPAGGRRRRQRPVAGQLDLLQDDEPVSDEGLIRTRATFHDVIRATEVHRYKAVIVENVVEATKWELFGWWLTGMTLLGYEHQTVCVSSAHIHGPGNAPAPQWRDRLYLVFTRTGIRRPDVWPRPAAWCPVCDEQVRSVQSWKRPDRPPIGKYRQQYVYRCSNGRCRHTIVEPYVAPAASAIDWTDLGTRIGDRKKPLVPATMARIRAGLALINHDSSALTIHSDTAPAGALDGGMLVPTGGGWNTEVSMLAAPFRTRTANPKGIEAGGIPPGAFITTFRRNSTPTDPRNPFATIAASGGHHALVMPYYRTGRARPADRPMGALTVKDRHAVVTDPAGALAIEDCQFRMLRPRESLRAQRFPDHYTVVGTGGEQTKQAGNAVSANVAHWLGRALTAVL
jgi:DNA (cytosine-5)-methyltransferase 1